MKKLFSLLAIFVTLNLPFACNPCGPFDNRPYKIVSISSTVGSLVENDFVEGVSTNFEVAAIRTVIDETQRIGFNKIENPWLLNAAYACDPVPPNVQELASINISSNRSIFSNGIEFKAGNELNDLFKIVFQQGEYSTSEFIVEQNSNPWRFIIENEPIYFQLIETPDSKIEQELLLKFTFGDELEYQVQTNVFTVE